MLTRFGKMELKWDVDDPNTFWLQTKVELSEEDKKEGKSEIVELRIDARVLPKEFSDQAPVGTGRTEPNMDPYLYPPVGRITFTTNPLNMLVSKALN